MHYEIRFVHPIAPRHTDVQYVDMGGEIRADLDAAGIRALAAALRARGMLRLGQRIREVRTTPEGCTVVFPSRVPAGSHALILRPLAESDLFYVHTRGNPDTHEPYGFARSHTVYDFLRQNLRPLMNDSPERTLTFFEVYYTGDASGDDRTRHVREVGGFFVPAGPNFNA